MKIERVEIYGFGKWIDQSFDFTEDNIICLYGENEAGKSTLQQFILYVLFGLPPRLRSFYKPKQSNRVGGNMTIQDKEIGTYTIERIEDEVNCLLPSGEKANEAWLRKQLNGLTKSMYTSVYAFSATDLSTIRNMKADDLSDVLFSVGLTGAASIHELEKRLEKEIGELFKKSGRKPMINEQLTKINKMYEQLQADKAIESEYKEKVEQKDLLEKEIVETKQQIRRLKASLLELEKIKQLLPLLKQYRLIEEKLQNYPERMPFPADGLHRYDTLKQQVLPLKSKRQMIVENIYTYEEKIKSLSKKLFDEELKEAETLLEAFKLIEVQTEKINSLENERQLLMQKIADLLRKLNLTEAQLEQISFPFHVEKSWQTLGDTSEALQRESEKITEDHQVLQEETERIDNEMDALEKKLLSDDELGSIEEEVERFRTQQFEIQQHKQWQGVQKKREKQSRIIFGATIVLAIITIFFAMNLQNYPLFLLPLLLLGVGFGQMYMAKNAYSDMKQVTVQRSTIKSIAELENLQRQIEEQRALQTELQVLKGEQKRLQLQRVQLDERKKLFAQKENKWMNDITKEQSTYPFLREIEPTYWVEFLQSIRHAQQLLEEKQKLERRIENITEEQIQFEHRLTQFAKTIQFDETMTINEVEHFITQQKSDEQLRNQYEKLLEENIEEQKELESQITVYEAEITKLFQLAQVDNEDDYIKLANTLHDKTELLNQRENVRQQLHVTISEEQLNEILIDNMEEQEVDVRILHVTEQLNELETALDIKKEQVAAIDIELKQLESLEHISSNAYLFEMEKGKLNELARKWAILKTAETALLRAKKTYQDKYLHEVISYTSKYFKRLTNGNYIDVIAPTASQLFQVEANNNIRYTVDELSQGTIDQLYISLRLAIGNVMSKKFIVPFMMDDAFVHFDDKRTKEIIQLLKEIARESDRQILLFTCKQHIAHKFDEASLQKLVQVSV